jgi:hypothetical protein
VREKGEEKGGRIQNSTFQEAMHVSSTGKKILKWHCTG